MRNAFLLIVMLSYAAQAQPRQELHVFSDTRNNWLWKPLQNERDGVFSLNEKESKLLWEGNPVIGGGHEGTIQFLSGAITTSRGVITQGDFVVNMNTIKSTDIKPESSAKDLEDHLKSDDFFSVAKFPTASFSIIRTESEPTAGDIHRIRVTGFLSIKGITNQVVFPARLIYDSQGNIRVTGELTINRIKWDILHQSKSIFKDLKDGIIDDEIKISVDLKFFTGC